MKKNMLGRYERVCVYIINMSAYTLYYEVIVYIFSIFISAYRTHVDRWNYGLCLCSNVFESTGFQ